MSTWKDPVGRPDPQPQGVPLLVLRCAVAGGISGVVSADVRNRGDTAQTSAMTPMDELAQACVAILAGAALPLFPTSHSAAPSRQVHIQRAACPLPHGITTTLFPYVLDWRVCRARRSSSCRWLQNRLNT